VLRGKPPGSAFLVTETQILRSALQVLANVGAATLLSTVNVAVGAAVGCCDALIVAAFECKMLASNTTRTIKILDVILQMS